MTPVRFSPSSLKEGRWYEYLIRFVLGGLITVFTGWVSNRYGPSTGCSIHTFWSFRVVPYFMRRKASNPIRITIGPGFP